MTSLKSDNEPESRVSLIKILENTDSLLWEYIHLAAMGLVQGIPQKLPTETWKTQGQAFQSSCYSPEINTRHRGCSFTCRMQFALKLSTLTP